MTYPITVSLTSHFPTSNWTNFSFLFSFIVHLKDVDYYYDQWSNCSTNELESTNATSKRARAMARIQQGLIAAQELGDEKLQVVTQLQDMIDQKTRQLDADYKNLDYGDKDDQALISQSPKDTRPNSPSAYIQSSSSNSNIKNELKGDDTGSGSISSNQSNNSDRINNPSTSANASNNNNPSNSNGGGGGGSGNSGDKNWKRSRRARNENSVSRSSSVNSFSNASKIHGIDISSDLNVIPNPIKISNTNTAQCTSAGTSSNSNQNKKQSGNSGKKRKRKSGRTQNSNGGNGNGNSNISGNIQQSSSARTQDDTPPLEETIDPDEPTYCLCDQISFGEMILCDNDLCPIEWFHFSCVSLTTKPKGKWFCPNCRGERPSVMKPKQQFLKELERYNREKEEKT